MISENFLIHTYSIVFNAVIAHITRRAAMDAFNKCITNVGKLDMKNLVGVVFGAAIISLVACGGGGGGGDGGGPTVDEDGILENLKVTNLNYSYPYASRTPAWGFDSYPECDDRSKLDDPGFFSDEGCPIVRPPGSDEWEDTTIDRLKKWDIAGEGLIPVKHNDSDLALQAMDAIESKLGVTLFDRNSIVNVADEDVERGIIISEGTARGSLGDPQPNICGSVHPIKQPIGPEAEWYDEYGVIFGPLVINIGSDDPNGCTQGQDLRQIAIHEFMHSLGMGTHFQGFGIGPIYSDNAWNVLHNIMINHQNTDEFNMIIEKRFPE